MKIVADENIPFVQQFFSDFGEVMTAPGRNLSAADVRDADVLVVRSVTRVNQSLLQGSRVRFVGTCTIGTDHLDTAYLRSAGIAYASAPGCNADGVVQYVLCALAHVRGDWRRQKVGVLGCGNVGARLCRALTALGVACIAYDPLLTAEQNPWGASLSAVLACDLVCMHTPYTREGPFPTHHLLGASELAQLRPGAVLLNAGRGGAVDNQALLRHLRGGADLTAVLDVWEHEPQIDTALLPYVALATPHIAGYSFEGKLKGAAMVHSALVDFLGWDKTEYAARCDALLTQLYGAAKHLAVNDLNLALSATYDIAADDARMRAALLGTDPQLCGQRFDQLRKTYPERREFGHFRLTGGLAAWPPMAAVGFRVEV